MVSRRSNEQIASWKVTYQGQAPGSPSVTLASGSGTPPATLTTFDPTVLHTCALKAVAYSTTNTTERIEYLMGLLREIYPKTGLMPTSKSGRSTMREASWGPW